MVLYNFVKITNNKDPFDFTIECTSMKNGRARVSCLRANLFAWEDNGGVGKWRPVWDYFFKDFSHYVCEKRDCANLAEAREYRQVVYERYRAKLESNNNILAENDLKTTQQISV